MRQTVNGRRSIRMVTEFPGPKSREILQGHEEFVAKPISVHFPVVAEYAEGALITDVDGNRYIDLMGGVGVMNVGHRHPKVMDAISSQIDKFVHTDYSVLPYEPLISLARRLADLVPGTGPRKSFFFNSGAEAVENAVKAAKAYTGRHAVLSFEGAFHGRTWMAMSLSSRVNPYKRNFGPFVSDVFKLPFPYTYRKPYPVSDEQYAQICLDAIERAFHTVVAAEDVAAIIVEPVQGEGGFIVPPPNFLPGLERICRKHGIMLIADEVQTGFGRTGKLFASEHFGIDPDIIVLGKSLAAGLPLSGVVGRAEIMDAVQDTGIGGTFVGNPVGCAAALAVLDIMEEEDLPGRARRQGEHMMNRFRSLQERCSLVGDVRGLGAMVAVELVRDRETKEPADTETAAILADAMSRGVLAIRAGIYGNGVRVLAPLVIEDDVLDEALDVLESAIEAAG